MRPLWGCGIFRKSLKRWIFNDRHNIMMLIGVSGLEFTGIITVSLLAISYAMECMGDYVLTFMSLAFWLGVYFLSLMFL